MVKLWHMLTADVQMLRAFQPLVCGDQCQKVRTTKVLKQTSFCKHSIHLISEGKRTKTFCLSEKQVTQKNPRADSGELVWASNILWEPGIASRRSTITHSIYISKSLCMPRSLSKRCIFIILIFHLQWGEKLQNDYKSSWIWERTLKSEIITELF